MYSHAAYGVLAAIEYDQCDATARAAGKYDGYGTGVFGSVGDELYCGRKRCGGSGELCRSERYRCKWDRRQCVDRAGVRLGTVRKQCAYETHGVVFGRLPWVISPAAIRI